MENVKSYRNFVTITGKIFEISQKTFLWATLGERISHNNIRFLSFIKEILREHFVEVDCPIVH